MDFAELLRRLAMDVPGLANRLRNLLSSPLAVVSIVTPTLATGLSTVTVEHGLGRPYVGGLVIGTDAVTPALTVARAASLASTGVDTAKYVTFRAAFAPGSNLTFTALVF